MDKIFPIELLTCWSKKNPMSSTFSMLRKIVFLVKRDTITSPFLVLVVELSPVSELLLTESHAPFYIMPNVSVAVIPKSQARILLLEMTALAGY
uniref:Uncharacterized protein n=1 Tax=Solanum tuberosum TaxID=4113 RepID=M1D6T0_SOLTU